MTFEYKIKEFISAIEINPAGTCKKASYFSLLIMDLAPQFCVADVILYE